MVQYLFIMCNEVSTLRAEALRSYLGRSKGLCSQGMKSVTPSLIFIVEGIEGLGGKGAYEIIIIFILTLKSKLLQFSSISSENDFLISYKGIQVGLYQT